LIAYSYETLGDTANAARSLEQYFAKEDSARLIAQDYAFRARTTLHNGGPILPAAEYYTKAFNLDSIPANKVEYAGKLAGLYKDVKDYSQQAKWLQFMYENKESRSNVDLFYWGLAHYNAQEYSLSDSVFVKYTTEYPENIFGYYWRALVNAAIDTNMTRGLAIPHYNKVVEMGEKDKTANRSMLLKAYAYLGGYEANITKNYRQSLEWFRKSAEADPSIAEIRKYIDLLEKWIAEGK
jgi:tetratricopeptide (TPR) repeat protein